MLTKLLRRNSNRHQLPGLFSFIVLSVATLFWPLPSANSAWAPAAPNAYVTTDLNLRAGPDTDYPAVIVIPAEAYVTIYACIQDLTWCDISYGENRGWVAAEYIQPFYQSRYMTVREYAPLVSLPTAPFDVRLYWSSFYSSEPFYGELDRWAAPGAGAAFQTSSFYEPLGSYGDWTEMQGQYVWVPRDVDAGWRPYTRGHWADTDDYGWFWVSDEPFGWATYHYGRWGFSHDVGWFWVPGTRWAPAWVAWRGSDDYLGWAPLPPAQDDVTVSVSIDTVPDYYWQVVPARSFLDVDISIAIVRDRSVFAPAFARTRPLGNVTIVNNVVVNKVVNVTYVEQKTQRRVVRERVAAATAFDPKGQHAPGKLAVFSPPPKNGGQPPRLRKLQEIAAVSKTRGAAGNKPAMDLAALQKLKGGKPLRADLGGQPPPPPPGGAGKKPADLAVGAASAGQCTGGKVLVGKQCRCPAGTVGNGQGVCVNPGQLNAARQALKTAGPLQCTGGKVPVGNDCRCPPGKIGNGQGVCVTPGQLNAARQALQGAGPLQCTGGKVAVGNQCRCPAGTVGNGQGICVNPAQLAAARQGMQAGGPQQCQGGRVLIGGQCRCPPGTTGNGQGVCVNPGQLAATGQGIQAGGPPQQCQGGRVFIGGQCRCPPGTTGNGQGVCVNPAQLGAARQALQAGGPPQQCQGGRVLIGGQCRCPPGTTGNGQGVCVRLR